jgi:hypothetical protein
MTAATVNHRAAQMALRARLVTLAELPAVRVWDNTAYNPVPGVPYVEEEYVPGGAFGLGLRITEDTGLYVIRWYGLAGTGLGALATGADALIAHFPREAGYAMSDGNTVQIRSRPSPYRGAIRRADAGFAVCVITIPWRIYTVRAA